MKTQKEIRSDYYRRGVEKNLFSLLESFSNPMLLRCSYNEQPYKQQQEIRNDYRALLRRATRLHSNVNYIAFVTPNNDGVLALNVLIDLCREDCFKITRLWYGGKVEIIQPNETTLENFIRGGVSLLSDPARIFQQPLIISRTLTRTRSA